MFVRSRVMGKDTELFNEATKVTAQNGEVVLDGPDGVDVKLTPEAAEETGDSLLEESVRARDQRRMRDNPHRAK
jgi:hypothetical protein